MSRVSVNPLDDIPTAPNQGPVSLEDGDEEVQEKSTQQQAVVGQDEKVNLIKTLEAMQRRAETNESGLVKVLADPMVREYLARKERGERVKLVSEEEEVVKPQTQQRQEIQASKPLEEMTNAELVAHQQKILDNAIDTKLSALFSGFEEKILKNTKPLVEKVQQLDGDRQLRQSQSLQEQIAAAKTKYSDFDKVAPLMKELNRTVQGLTVEELYHMTKLRAGLPPVTQKEIETERPNNVPRERQAVQRNASHLKGRRGFTELLDSALETNALGS